MLKEEELLKLSTPAVVLDLDVVEKNIEDMLEDCKKHGIKHRPHVKTHRSSYLANLQVQKGCSGVTAAKLGEADVMAENGIKDIFIAYPIVGKDKLQRLFELSEKVKVSTIVNSFKAAKELSDYYIDNNKVIDVLIEVDGGINRGGLKLGEALLNFAESIRDLHGIHVNGLMYYGGLIYDAHNIDEVDEYTKKECLDLVESAELLRQRGFDMNELSAGSSFSGKRLDFLSGITEIRAGHYIFNDCGQLDIGLANTNDCALFIETTVIAKPDNNTVICDVGTKSLTSDSCHYRPGFGYVVNYPEIEIYKLNEEHAFMRTKDEISLNVGDKIRIIPNHACVIMNLAEKVYGFRNGAFERLIPVDARNKSV